MITNTAIPIHIPFFYNYILTKYNINIYEFPIDDWREMIHINYCKNIIDNKFCLKKYKKDLIGIDFCSKCCEKKKIKRKNVYKKKKCKESNTNNDSGFYSETDNNADVENINVFPENKKYIKFGNIDVELNNKNNYLINNLQNLKSENNVNHYINDNFITFGELTINIEQKNGIKNDINNYNMKKDKYNDYLDINTEISILNNINIEQQFLVPKILEKEAPKHIYFEDSLSENSFLYDSDEEIHSENILNNAFIDIRYIDIYMKFIINELDKLKYNEIDKKKWAENIFKSLEYFCFIPNKYKIYKNIYEDTHLHIDDLEHSKEYLRLYTP
jgi:hypothetical protein